MKYFPAHYLVRDPGWADIRLITPVQKVRFSRPTGKRPRAWV